MRELHFYFDFISPYAYFSWRWLQPFCRQHRLTLIPHPVVFGKLLDHWGQLGPAEVKPKKAALYRYCYRYAHAEGFNFNPPQRHPFNPLPALRLSLKEVSGEQQQALISAIFEAGWSRGADLSCEHTLKQLVTDVGLDADITMARIQEADVKALLVQETQEALAQDVFGVPTFVLDGELFWGNDQREHLKLCVEGDDPLDREALEEMLARARGIDRKQFQNR